MEDKERGTKEVGGKAEGHHNTEVKGSMCFKRVEWSTVSEAAERPKKV